MANVSSLSMEVKGRLAYEAKVGCFHNKSYSKNEKRYSKNEKLYVVSLLLAIFNRRTAFIFFEDA